MNRPLHFKIITKVNEIEYSFLGTKKRDLKNRVHVVTDTSVFIKHIDYVIKLTTLPIYYEKYIAYVPWEVLQELDKLQSDKSNGFKNQKAREAMNELETLFESEKSIIVQSGEEAKMASLHFVEEKSDDKILSAAVQLKKNGIPVNLLSCDKNLRLKAWSFNIITFKHFSESTVAKSCDELDSENGMKYLD